MTLQPPLSARRTRPTWAAAWTGAGAVVVLLALAVIGRADPAPALAAAAVVGLISAWQTSRALRTHRFLLLAKGRGGAEGPDAAAAFEAVFDHLPDPAMVITASGVDDLATRRVATANPAARELLRIPREGALLVAALRHPEVLEAVDESLFGGLTRTAAWESGGAQDRLWRAWSTPLPRAPGADPRALLVLHEETDARSAERTRADFMANASHELRTPLASLSGFIETLRGHARNDEAARDRFLGIMAAQAERMARLVDDLLSLSRIELNEHVPPAGVVDLSMAAMDVCDALGPLARERGVRLEPSLPERALIVGDRDQIVQVIQNLVDNGLKYSVPGGTVRVEVETDLAADAATLASAAGTARLSLLTPDRTPEQRYVALRVSDQGPGIEREHLPRLAERFYRVEGQKSGERSGTGLGLAIVKHVTNRHRGGFAVESAPGRGSTFVVYFPQLEAKASAAFDLRDMAAPGGAPANPAAVTKVS